MEKPEYELGPLKLAVNQCRTNIAAFEQAIKNELRKIDEISGYIEAWEAYNQWLETESGSTR